MKKSETARGGGSGTPRLAGAATPLMRQYAKIKAQHPDTLLLFRMGDFYETFQQDAHIAAKILGITLTKRGNGAAGNVPLAGFPHHALNLYLPKLLRAGQRVAICEQLEDPKLARGLVKRDVIEVVTPGVAFDGSVVDRKQNNFLAALYFPFPLGDRMETAPADGVIGLAFVDVTTAEFSLGDVPFAQLRDHLSTIGPSEILIAKRDRDLFRRYLQHDVSAVGAEASSTEDKDVVRPGQPGRGPVLTPVDDWVFNFDYAYELLVNQFETQSLKGFGCEGFRAGIVAGGAVLTYLQETQKSRLAYIRGVHPYIVSDAMVLDAATQRNLELVSPLGTEIAEGTLLAILDRTLTPMGSRLLKKWLLRPLRDVVAINRRLDAVEELCTGTGLRGKLREILDEVGDTERLTSRIATGRASPRDVAALKDSLDTLPAIISALENATSPTLCELRGGLAPLPDVTSRIAETIVDDPPAALSDGSVIREGRNTELDGLRTLASSSKQWIADLQQSERARTGIPSLRVGFNSVFGYYIEVTNTHREKIPSDYIRKQTLVNAERYITPALKEYEEKILHAEERIAQLESQLFDELRTFVASFAPQILSDAAFLAELDCYASLAAAAAECSYNRPEVADDLRLEINGGRHPVIERLLPPGDRYIQNDTLVDAEDQQILIITGPNMSGKSSYLRQVGLIVLLAQVGSFVPAESSHVGIVDRIFTRVGASDSITTGESTFLVEMHEAANIVNSATKRSLILLDEVGRGTSTFDGISIAWALTEYLHERVRARTLFATHYHEMNELADLYPRIRNYKVDVQEYGEKVIFLHKVVPGFADHSYGIHVAQMAGLPEEVTMRAKEILANLEQTELSPHGGGAESKGVPKRMGRGRIEPRVVQMTLFELQDDPVREELRKLDLNSVTPIEALNVLASLKKKVEKP